MRPLAGSVVEALAAACEPRRFAAGDALIRQGHPADGLWLFASGRADVRLRRKEGSDLILAQMERGDIAGEMALLTGAPRNADVVATEPGEALFLSVAAFRALEARTPEILGILTELTAQRLGKSVADGLADKVLGGFRVVRPAGRGATAVVYEAVRLDDGRTVALKMLSHRFSRDRAAMDLFERESRMLLDLAHPGVATCHGSFDAYGTKFLVMEFLDGPSLWDAITLSGPLPVRDARGVAGAVAGALSFVHAKGVVHCDVKPSNVMLARSGDARLTDFGIARSVDSPPDAAASQVRICGTPRYMAPELFLGAPPSASADLYAFGCTMIEMFTGETPFPQEEIGALVLAKRRFGTAGAGDGPSPLEAVPPDFRPVCAALIAPDPEDRLRDAGALAALAGPVSADVVESTLRARRHA
ncbi:MAG: Serine/threonine-protein kinase PknD [Planctomycetes bacterium]|nr:Serine/threonine-protein kinase PknD [Planctomycetota bacterium]